jgi:serine protease
VKRSTAPRAVRRRGRAAGDPRRRPGRLLLIALAAATALAGALAGAAPALAAAPRAKAPAPAGRHLHWTLVRLHGHTIRVRPHGRFGVVPQFHRGLRPQASGGQLVYNGGPVAHNPTVYLDFWGSQWGSDPNGAAQYMQDFFNGLGGSADNWSTINSQYTDSSGQGPAFGGPVLGGTWFDNAAAAPASASQSQIAAEAVTAAQYFGVSGDSVDIFVLSPSGTQPDGFPNAGWCAWHDYTSSSSGNIPYTNMPYVLDAGASCGASSVQSQLDGFSIVGGHEYAEAMTDPEPATGWVDSAGAENGDKCAWQNLSTLSLSTGSFAVQPIWSNYDSACTLSAP